MLVRKHIEDRATWLSERNCGIGASEAAAVCGLSPWQTATDVWKLKTGLEKAKDLSDNEAVQTGVRYEPALRDLYKARHPEYAVYYFPYDMLYQEERPYIFATLDGEITTSDGTKGILEIKTSTPNNRAAWEKWEGRIPDHYYAQVCSQLIATGFEFADLFAGLFAGNGEMVIREYHIERSQCESDLEWLLEKETAFWKSVTDKTIPKMSLKL